MKKPEILLLLHDIRSVYNVGAIFRTADSIGVSKIYLSGYTPSPVDRFGNPRSDFAKCALGAEKSVPWEHAKSPAALAKKLKRGGCGIIAVEQAKDSIDYKKARPRASALVIVGNEVKGVSKNLLRLADEVVEIPMKGEKESLNVSVAAGIILYRLFDR